MSTQLRTSSLTAGIALAAMALLAPLGVMVALPAGATGQAGLVVLAVAVLDVVAALALYPMLTTGGALLAQVTVALRLVYAAVFAAAAGQLFGAADVERFETIWDAGLLVFGLHLVLVGAVLVRSVIAPSWLGGLVALAGLGYVIDTVLLGLVGAPSFSVAEFAFVGEVALLIWLIGWGGRTIKIERAELAGARLG